jgi:hypothetical protein
MPIIRLRKLPLPLLRPLERRRRPPPPLRRRAGELERRRRTGALGAGMVTMVVPPARVVFAFLAMKILRWVRLNAARRGISLQSETTF